MKKIVCLCVILTLCVYCFSQNHTHVRSDRFTSDGKKIENFAELDVKPNFQGGEAALLNYLKENIVYPAEQKEKGIEGKVMIRFNIDEYGKIIDVESMTKEVDPALQREAIRVVSSMPDWTPGELNGKKVVTSFVVPINFRIPKEDNK